MRWGSVYPLAPRSSLAARLLSAVGTFEEFTQSQLESRQHVPAFEVAAAVDRRHLLTGRVDAGGTGTRVDVLHQADTGLEIFVELLLHLLLGVAIPGGG